MVTSTRYIGAASALAFGLVAAQTNPDAEGACEETQGGANACGPNGSEAWLNTGVDGDGWEPPFLDINTLSHISLDDYYQGVGSQCEQYDEYFQSSGSKYNIDPAILAFIAMQESSCNADEGGPTPVCRATTMKRREDMLTRRQQGLMQCDASNCQNGQSSCQYPIQDNVDCGAWVLRSGLDSADGNAVKALGAYNGWFTAGSGLNGNKGLTDTYPCSSEGQSNGSPQNLDYLHETLNGWFMGYDVYGDDADKVDGSYACSGNCGGGDLC